MRKILNINKNWAFLKDMTQVPGSHEGAELVDLPHTWNALMTFDRRYKKDSFYAYKGFYSKDTKDCRSMNTSFFFQRNAPLHLSQWGISFDICQCNPHK